MKRMLDKIKRGEKGQVLIIAVVLMLLGGLIIGPVLAYVGTGLKVGKDVHEERMDELYAADAGVEDGLWHLQDIERLKQLVEDFEGFPPGSLPPDWTPADYVWPVDGIPYDPTDPDDPSDNINDKDVAVIIHYLPGGTFQITSEATSADGSSTRIDAYVSGLDFSNLLDNAITSLSTVTLQPGAEVNDGDVVYCEGDPPSEDQVNNGEIIQDCEVAWPTADELSGWYRDQVAGVPPVGDTTILFGSDTPIGPLYVDGDLTLRSTENDVTLTLQDTIYVTGTLKTDQNKTFTLDFNNQTIFVESDDEYSPGAVNVSWKTSVTGSGCLIAIGGIDFGPNVAQGDPGEDFLFVLSIDDITFAHPQGNFNGSFAGNVHVQLHPGSNITWSDPDDYDLNFPMGDYAGGKLVIVISAWEITLEGSD